MLHFHIFHTISHRTIIFNVIYILIKSKQKGLQVQTILLKLTSGMLQEMLEDCGFK